MKKRFRPFWALAFAVASAVGAQSSHDPLGEKLFPPELIMKYQSEIGLTEEQRDSLSAEIHSAQDRFTEMRKNLDKEMAALGELLNKERIDEPAALQQFDEIQKREREIKRAHLYLLIRLKNQLTPEQQDKAQKLKKQLESRVPPKALGEKIAQIKAGVADWQSSGRDPSPVVEIMNEFEPLIKAGKFQEAEAVLNRALKLLKSEGALPDHGKKR